MHLKADQSFDLVQCLNTVLLKTVPDIGHDLPTRHAASKVFLNCFQSGYGDMIFTIN